MDIFVILDPDPHEILCGSETLDTVTDFDRDAGYPIRYLRFYLRISGATLNSCTTNT